MLGFHPGYRTFVLNSGGVTVAPSSPTAQRQNHMQTTHCLLHREKEVLYS